MKRFDCLARPRYQRPRWAEVIRPALGCWLIAAPAAVFLACDGPSELNVVVVTLDTLRTDSLGIYGNPDGHSPHIDKLAAEGTVFDAAVTAIGTTFPSHASLFTGLYPRRHGVRWNGDTLPDSFTTLAELLSAKGYETGAFVSVVGLLNRGGLDQGFASVSHPRGGQGTGMRKGDLANDEAEAWLRARNDKPFFLWVHYFEPHSPYTLTPYSTTQLAGYEGPGAEGLTVKEFYALREDLPLPQREHDALRSLYDGRVREADRLVGDVVAELESLSLLDSTLLVLAGDHGQHLGEHGRVGHGFSLWQEVLQVPLLIRDPRETSSRRVAQRVGIVDLMPTILDLLGLPVPRQLDGDSFADALRGEELASRLYFSEARAVGESKRSQTDAEAVAVFYGPAKVVVRGGTIEAYDLESDPGELHPLSPEERPDRVLCLAELAEEYQQLSTVEAQQAPDESVKAELRALGYLD